jgi:hypothetical protein
VPNLGGAGGPPRSFARGRAKPRSAFATVVASAALLALWSAVLGWAHGVGRRCRRLAHPLGRVPSGAGAPSVRGLPTNAGGREKDSPLIRPSRVGSLALPGTSMGEYSFLTPAGKVAATAYTQECPGAHSLFRGSPMYRAGTPHQAARRVANFRQLHKAIIRNDHSRISTQWCAELPESH